MFKKILKNIVLLLRLIKYKRIIQAYKLKKINKELSKLDRVYQVFETESSTDANSLTFYNNLNIVQFYKMVFEFYQNLETIKPDKKYLYIEAIKKYNPTTLNIFQWLSLYRFFSLKGHFFIANLFRDKAISLSFSLKSNIFTPMRLYLKFALSLELGDLKTAEKALKIMKVSPFRLLLQINAFDRVLSIYFHKEVENKYSFRDHDFEKLTKNKTIALVGPAPSKKNYNSEIDSLDFVVRLNFNGEGYKPAENKGTKINCSYYNGESSKKIFLDNNFDATKLDYYCYKGNFKSINKKYPNLNNSRKIEYFLIEFDGSFNMIQIAILDLLKFKPKLIKLYGTNFFLSEKTHSDSYVHDFTKRVFPSKCNSFTVHNPILQFRTVKNLRYFGLIKVNDELNTILDMDETAYLKKFDSLHGIRAHRLNK